MTLLERWATPGLVGHRAGPQARCDSDGHLDATIERPGSWAATETNDAQRQVNFP